MSENLNLAGKASAFISKNYQEELYGFDDELDLFIANI